MPRCRRLDRDRQPARGLAQLADRIVDLHVLVHARDAVVDGDQAARAEERPLIASVFRNRLTDPTFKPATESLKKLT